MPHIKSILQKGPYLPCVSMAGRALLAGYHWYMHHGLYNCLSPLWYQAIIEASAFRRRRHYVFSCPSVRPSVRSLKYTLLTCTWASGPPDQLWPFYGMSIRPERFPGICRRTHGGNSLKFYMLMYLDHLKNWLVYGHSLLIFRILALFWPSETGQIGGFRAFPGEHMEEMAWNFACWCILTTFRTD